MGRKKRKISVEETEGNASATSVTAAAAVAAAAAETYIEGVNPAAPPPLPPADPRQRLQQASMKDEIVSAAVAVSKDVKDDQKKASSGYAMTTHSAEILAEDVYVSDGSESDEDLMAEPVVGEDEEEDEGPTHSNPSGRSIEMVLGASKMGLMRRGLHQHSLLVQPNRQWSRQPTKNSKDEGADTSLEDDAAAEERRKREQEEELAKLDPAQRAARLLAEKQRKLEEAKIAARRLESEENAGRDPCLFSKRTSFDIRFDQIDDKPWTRGGDMSDFFNYGFTEEDWLSYAEQQLIIRQELVDASRQKRQPDPSIVPVIPKAPKKQAPRVAVVGSSDSDKDASMDGASDNGQDDDDENAPVAGPVLIKKEDVNDAEIKDGSDITALAQGPAKNEEPEFVDVQVGAGGAWGAGAAPGSMLAKLIEEQEKQYEQQYEQNGDDSVMDDASQTRGGAVGVSSYNQDEASVTSSYYGGGDGGYNNSQDPRYQQQKKYQQRREWNQPHSSQVGNSDYSNGHNQGNANWNTNNYHHGAAPDWNNQGGVGGSYNNNYQPQHQEQGWGGRDSYRGGRGGGRFGRGEYGGRGRGGRGGGRGYQHGKRPREGYEDQGYRR
jgi:hypothetical protein